MATKNDLIAKAEGELGYLEKSNQYWLKYGIDCLYTKTKYAGADNVQKYAYDIGHYKSYGWAAWCQSFVNWLFVQTFGRDLADKLLCGMVKSASTMDVKNKMVNAGRQVALNKAEAGDIVFRSRNGGGHVGLCVGRSKDGKIISVEGNSSSTDISSWNGGAVVKHTGASWEWCCRPDWSLIPKPETWHWVLADGKWYYQNSNGENKHGWNDIKESQSDWVHRYYFEPDGAMVTGWQDIGDRWYYFEEGSSLDGALWHEADDRQGALELWYFK